LLAKVFDTTSSGKASELIFIHYSFFNAAWLLVIMGSSNSSSSSGKKGGTGRELYFDPDSDQSYGREYNISHAELLEKMGELIDVREAIEEIWVYKCPLGELQLSQVFLNHQFVVFGTPAWWWSIEKNDQEIVIQRSKNCEWVQDHLKREARKTPVKLMSSDKGSKCMKDLLEFLYQKKELPKCYNVIEENCQDFAQRIFDEFAAKKYHGTIMGSRD